MGNKPEPPSEAPRPLARVPSITLSAVLLVALYYLSYRYPLQISDSRTSPTYADTPVALQAGKYALLALIAATGLGAGALSTQKPIEALQKPHAFSSSLLLLIGVFATVKGALLSSVDLIGLGLVCLTGAALSTFTVRWPIDYRRLSAIVVTFAGLSILVDFVQLALFILQGRLPALAYEGSISVRFGAILDDPNGYAVVIALLLPTVIATNIPTFVRGFLAIALIGTLVITQSFTGITACVAAFLIGSFVLRWQSPRAIGTLAIFLIALVFMLAWLTSESTLFQSILGTKNGSFSDHAQSFGVVQQLDLQSLLGLGRRPTSVTESGYVFLLANFGIIFTAAYVGIGIAAMLRLRKRIASETGRTPILYGAYFYLIGYLLATANLNLISSYPANILYIFVIVLSMFAPIDSGSPLAPRTAALRTDK